VCGTTPLPANFSCNLSVTPLGTAPTFGGFQLSGSAVASQAGTVSAVVTLDAAACGPTNSQANCPFTNNSGLAALTARNLDGLNGDPQPVPVSAGQVISVTVTISFQ
jgi:hypothetical protein